MKIIVEKRWWRWLLAIGLAAIMSILEVTLVDVKYELMHVGMVLACGVLAISMLFRVELKSKWLLPLELLFAAFCGVFLIHIAINGQPLQLGAFVYNMHLSLMFVLLLTALTGRPKLASIIWITFCWMFGLLDEIVYQFRGNQIVLNDIGAIRTAVSVMGNYRIEFHTKIMISVITYIAAMNLFVRSSFPEWKKLRKILPRLAFVAAAVCAAILPYAHLDRYSTYTWVKQGSKVPGILYEFMLELDDMNVKEPEGYSPEAVQEIAQEYTVAPSGETRHPHVIAIMIESWADLNVLGEIETSEEVMPFLTECMENSLHGKAISSVYGGSTATSEWEFLTGNTMAFMPSGSMVYRQFVQDDIRSMVDVMRNNGYSCIAMHPYYSTGWNRDRVYPLMGFDETWFLEDMEWGEQVREYTSDAAFVDKIIEKFESRDSDQPMFMFGVTMQNHGGYTVDGFEPIVRMTNLDVEFEDVNQYLSLVHLTDSAMQTLIEYFEDCGEDVVLLAFGDHQPRLRSRFIEEMNNPDMVQLHTVPYFIWNNFEEDQAETLSPTSINYLSMMLMEEAGIDLPPYYQFLKEAQAQIPAINGMGLIEDGKIVDLDDATPAQKEILEKYNILEYAAVFDWDVGDAFYAGEATTK